MNLVAPIPMTVDEFLVWSERQPQGRYELQDGRVIMQQSQNWAHLRIKAAVLQALSAAIVNSGVPYFACPDGATVRIAGDTAYEPDALVAPLPFPDDRALEIPNPVIVVEVVSPSGRKRDLQEKAAGYAQVPSIAHYLVIDPVERCVWCHRRNAEDASRFAEPARLGHGRMVLDPPGIAVEVADIL